LSNAKGQQLNAVYGFFMVFLKALGIFKPKYVAACFDFPGKNFRHADYEQYKATRHRAPDDLYEQIALVKKVLAEMGIKIYEMQGFEADDLIATAVVQANGLQRIILSGDMDNAQLVNDDVQIYGWTKNIRDNVIYDAKRVVEHFGVNPDQVVDYKALVGDASDNIPGGEGIGKKTAVEWLSKYKSVSDMFSQIENGEAWDMPQKMKEKLMANKDKIILSYNLAKTKTDVFNLNLEDCHWDKYDKSKALQIFNEFEFKSLIDRLP
jgi:DNA polymerase-1